jgi:hypothetical protein
MTLGYAPIPTVELAPNYKGFGCGASAGWRRVRGVNIVGSRPIDTQEHVGRAGRCFAPNLTFAVQVKFWNGCNH